MLFCSRLNGNKPFSPVPQRIAQRPWVALIHFCAIMLIPQHLTAEDLAESLPELNEQLLSAQLESLDQEDSDTTIEDYSASEKPVEKGIIENSRKIVGDSYLSLTSSIDNFLSGKAIEREQKNTYLKGELRYTYFEHRSNKTDARLKGKMDLPNTKERLKLFFDSDLQEENQIEDRTRSVSTGERLEEESTTAGLEFGRRTSFYKWRPTVRAGAKFNKSLDTFIRFRAERYWKLDQRWVTFFRQDIWYLDNVGWGETTRHEIFGPVAKDFALFFITFS